MQNREIGMEQYTVLQRSTEQCIVQGGLAHWPHGRISYRAHPLAQFACACCLFCNFVCSGYSSSGVFLCQLGRKSSNLRSSNPQSTQTPSTNYFKIHQEMCNFWSVLRWLLDAKFAQGWILEAKFAQVGNKTDPKLTKRR